ncbi:unnamed protein product [Periconia digitata]|uniref:C2H2-type domain-containing protein n=1 Tax=Periconia digitata TaxID=1303443 RepID=A0A9W4XWV1_9PLEO|nr:unnamed protein product [Periconia digitata]
MREPIDNALASDYFRAEVPDEMKGGLETSWCLESPTFQETGSVPESYQKLQSSPLASTLTSYPLSLDGKAESTNHVFLTRDESSHTKQLSPTFLVPSLAHFESKSPRSLHLSRSPLDNLQAELKKYGQMENNWNEELDKRQKPDQESNTSGTQDWSFVKRRLELPEHIPNHDCPSMTTGSTLSSRNSSTRSTKSNKWTETEVPTKGRCPIPECGRMMRDLAAHLLTHQAERPEKCPVDTCEYHTKGFARPYDKVRHTLTHFNGMFACQFCTSSVAVSARTFSRCDAFLRHLVNAHDVEPVSPGRRDELCSTRPNKPTKRFAAGNSVVTCTLCTEPFDAQGYYEHLRGCVLRHVTRRFSTPDTRELAAVETVERIDHCPDNSITSTSKSGRASSTLNRAKRASTSSQEIESPANHHRSNSRDHTMAELTASSRCLSLTSSHCDRELSRSSTDEETDWTDDAGTPDSAPDTEDFKPILSPVKTQLVNSIMAEFHRMFDKELRSHHSGASSGASGYRESSGSSSYSSASFISRKRSLSGGSTPPDNNDGDDSHKRRRPDPKSVGGKNAIPEVRFACPYYKRNPGRHQTFTSCRDPGFITVARLKEHLYRRHLLPIQCNRCCSTFANEPILREHQRDFRGCEVKEHIPLEGFDKDQERKLKSKKRSLVYQSEEDKWNGVYKILFPDDNEADMPSPYIEYQPCNSAQINETPNIAQFHEFSRLELPRLVRRTLEVAVEQEAQPLEEKLKERLVDIVRDCQSQLISLFQTTQARPMKVSELTPHALLPIAATDEDGKPSANSATDQHRNQENAGTFHPQSFQDFDSFALAVTAENFIPIPATRDIDQYKQTTTQDSSGSPDSGYDSNTAWLPRSDASNTMAVHQHQRHLQQPHLSFQLDAATFNPSASMYSPQHPLVATSFQQQANIPFNGAEFATGMNGYREFLGGACDVRFPEDAWTAYGEDNNGNRQGSQMNTLQ